MQLQKSIEVYLADLMQSGYTKQDIDRKAVILRRHLSYALALYHPAMLRTLLNLSEIRLYNRGAVKKDIGPQRREAAQRFVSVFRSRIVHGVSYITIAAWIHPKIPPFYSYVFAIPLKSILELSIVYPK